MTPRLRLAIPADTDEIAAVFFASRRLLTFLPELHSVDEDRAFIRDVVLTRSRVTVAERSRQIVGFIAESDGWIEHLYVSPAGLGTGIGSALVADAKSRNHTLQLWCFAENVSARRFYERHGFQGVRQTDGSGNEAGAPDIEYRWERPGGRAAP